MDFMINGFPENESHSTNNKNSGNGSANEIEDMLKAMGFDMSSAPQPSGDISDIFSNIMSLLGMGSFAGSNNYRNNQKNTSCNQQCSTSNVDDEEKIIFNNGDVAAFIADGHSFASVSVSFEENFKETFLNDHNIDEETFSVDVLRDDNYFSIDFPKESFFKMFDSVSLIGFSDAYLLFSANPIDSDDLGIFFAVVKSKGEYCVVVPKYGNPYIADENGVSLYNCVESPNYFENGTFKFINLSKIRLALEWMFVEEKRVILSPLDIGTIKQLDGIVWDEKLIRNFSFFNIGYIVLNNTSAAKQFKKDIDCETETVPLYLRVEDKDFNVIDLKKLLDNVDFNTSDFMKYSEIRFMNGMSYVDFGGSGDILKFIQKIARNKVNDKDYLY